MSDPIIPAAIATPDPSVQGGYPSGLRFMAPGTPLPHDGVVYRSRGAVLIIGDAVTAANVANVTNVARELSKWTRTGIALFAPGGGTLRDLPPTVKAVGGRIVSLQGHLGRFSASVRVAVDKVEDAGIFSANADRYFDLVLDLCHEPLLRQSVLPYGYYAPGDDAMALAQALQSLRQLTGDFHKPKYFDYRPQLCTRGAMGVTGCTRCIDVCSTGAIRSSGEKIEVDPYLCQGCASCTLACPTGALAFQQPTVKVLQSRLNELLAESPHSTDARFLVVHDASSRHLLRVWHAAGVLPFEVNPLSAFSDVLWLAALTSGVQGVVLAVPSTTSPQGRELIEQKRTELCAVLASLGGNPAALQVVIPANVGSAIDQIRSSAQVPPSAVAPSDIASLEKRTGFLAVADAFFDSNKVAGTVVAGEPGALGVGSAFGTVLVDAEKCTICHACTHLCPTGALSGLLDPAPALLFTEGLCVQCGLCRHGCPEQAIELQPRFVPDVMVRNASRQLASDYAVPCTSCGTLFIGRRKLAMSLALMQEHAKDLPGGLESLRMCPSCRQRETMRG